jgi:hypothetical protein
LILEKVIKTQAIASRATGAMVAQGVIWKKKDIDRPIRINDRKSLFTDDFT